MKADAVLNLGLKLLIKKKKGDIPPLNPTNFIAGSSLVIVMLEGLYLTLPSGLVIQGLLHENSGGITLVVK